MRTAWSRAMRPWICLLAACLVGLCLVGCASEPYEPLVCDPQREGDSAFGYVSGGGLGSSVPRILVIDGDCRFWALHFDPDRGRHSEARTGVLSADELDAINRDLLTGPWRSVDGVHFRREPPVSDSGSTTLWREDIEGGCAGWCRNAGNLGVLESAAVAWLDVLYERGEALSGPVEVIVSRWNEGGVAWTGTTPLASALVPNGPEGPSIGSVLVERPSDVALLRAIRASTNRDDVTMIRDQGVSLFVSIRDVLPTSTWPSRW